MVRDIVSVKSVPRPRRWIRQVILALTNIKGRLFMENPSLYTEPRSAYPIDFKLTLDEMAPQPNACVAKIVRENGINDNVLFKWIRLWQKESRVSRRLPPTRTVQISPLLLPVEIVKETSAMTEAKPHVKPLLLSLQPHHHAVSSSDMTK